MLSVCNLHMSGVTYKDIQNNQRQSDPEDRSCAYSTPGTNPSDMTTFNARKKPRFLTGTSSATLHQNTVSQNRAEVDAMLHSRSDSCQFLDNAAHPSQRRAGDRLDETIGRGGHNVSNKSA